MSTPAASPNPDELAPLWATLADAVAHRIGAACLAAAARPLESDD